MSNPANTGVPTDEQSAPARTIELTVNGRRRQVAIEDRQLLVEVVRGQLGLTGTHIGCLSGDCGACTLRVDGRIAKSCLLLAASVDGADITTIEGYAPQGELDDIQQAFWDHDAFQCGFCIPGFLFAARDLLDVTPAPSEDDVRTALQGNLCRCTGYVNYVAATRDAAARIGQG
jgi:carbon-monoxide dehydrogenase small subunit